MADGHETDTEKVSALATDTQKQGAYHFGAFQQEECSICYEENVKECVVLRCKHVYHKECIDKWLVNNTTCPQCRYDLV